MARILILSPHPDDESIGCGGTIRKHIVQKDIVEIIFLTSGEKGDPQNYTAFEMMKIREKEARAAAKTLGVKKIEFWREPDGALCVTKKLSNHIYSKLLKFRPNIIYVTHDKEIHPDHRAAAQATREGLSLFLKSKASLEKPVILMYEVWTPIREIDQMVDISPYIGIKLAAIKSHASQCGLLKYHEAALALNRYRGEMYSWPGGDYAEVFKELKIK